RLKLDPHPGPYYLDYTINETDDFKVSAVFGALTDRSRHLSRQLDADPRVGAYALDNSGFGRSRSGFGGMFSRMHYPFGNSVSVDNNYDALRHDIWLLTDSQYKGAIENLEAKKAYLEQNITKERPDDLSREEPVVDIAATGKLSIDENK